MRKPLVIGHRGFAARFPDNSLDGVRAALAVGADGVEVDVRPSQDGVWVCHHDLRLDGMPVGELSWVALRARGVPALDDVLDAVPKDRWLFLEVKPLSRVAMARNFGRLLERLGRRAGFLRVISSSLVVLGEVEREAPGVPLSWVFAELPAWLPVGVDLAPRHTLAERLAATGRSLHPWTVNRARRMRKLLALGVASITTNRPDVGVEVVGA